MRNKIIVANWKMHKTIKEAVEFVEKLKKNINLTNAEVGVAPPFTALSEVSKIKNGIKLVAQNCFYEEKGA
ncbi:MAG: triose-phosphate isomerase, partial [bacterium]|nr:triose-phosphate isomerase [bacterium]